MMFFSYLNVQQKWLQHTFNTMHMYAEAQQVVQSRMELMRTMMCSPTAAMSPANWIELQRMCMEKVFAFNQSATAAMRYAQKSSSHTKVQSDALNSLLQAQKDILKPIQKTVHKNAHRLK